MNDGSQIASASLIVAILALIVAGMALYLTHRQTRASEATAKIEQGRREEEIAQARRAQNADVTVESWTPRATSTRRSGFTSGLHLDRRIDFAAIGFSMLLQVVVAEIHT